MPRLRELEERHTMIQTKRGRTLTLYQLYKLNNYRLITVGNGQNCLLITFASKPSFEWTFQASVHNFVKGYVGEQLLQPCDW